MKSLIDCQLSCGVDSPKSVVIVIQVSHLFSLFVEHEHTGRFEVSLAWHSVGIFVTYLSKTDC